MKNNDESPLVRFSLSNLVFILGGLMTLLKVVGLLAVPWSTVTLYWVVTAAFYAGGLLFTAIWIAIEKKR
jgi:hypothetical protein